MKFSEDNVRMYCSSRLTKYDTREPFWFASLVREKWYRAIIRVSEKDVSNPVVVSSKDSLEEIDGLFWKYFYDQNLIDTSLLRSKLEEFDLNLTFLMMFG